MYFELKPSSTEMSLSFLHFSSPLPGMFSFLGGAGGGIYAAFLAAVVFFFLFLKISFAFTSCEQAQGHVSVVLL